MFAAETVCNDNGGVGWEITDGGITNLSLPFYFGDVSTIFDVNISTDITHTYIGDLTAKVTSPQLGTEIRLFERPGTTGGDTAASGNLGRPPGGWGCSRNNIVVTFDDEAASGTNIENLCPPATDGIYLPHDPAPNNLSAFDGEDPSGNWNFYLSDSANGDTGTLNQACITAAFAGITFDKWVSTNNSCSDTSDVLSVTPGTDVYFCYIVTNPGTETFTINPGDTSDDQGHDISALETTYAQGVTQTVIVGPIVAGGPSLPENTTTVNNAQLTATFATTNYSGTLVTDETASLTVNVVSPTPPADGVKQLYFDALDTTSPDLTRDPTNALVDTLSPDINGGASFTLNQGNAFTAPFTLSGGNDVVVQINAQRTNQNGSRTIDVELVHGISGAAVASGSISWNAGGWQVLQVPVTITADETFAANDFIRVIITNNNTNSRRRIQLRTINTFKSELQIQSSTVINVDSINTYAAAWPSTTKYSSYEPGSTVFIRALVSDPFGNTDITSATITIDSPASPPSVVTAVAMTSVDTPTPASRLYEYQYTIPASPEGTWPVSVTANEGVEGTVSHTGTSSFSVGAISITISKTSAVISDPINATNPKAIPGAIVEYTMGISNSGFGYVDVDSTVLTDPIAPGSTFFFGSPIDPLTFIDGTVTSGLTFTFSGLSSSADDIDFSNDGGITFVTPTTDASGFDTTSPPINFIRINPKGAFKGSTDGINNPSAQMKFRVRID